MKVLITNNNNKTQSNFKIPYTNNMHKIKPFYLVLNVTRKKEGDERNAHY